MARKKVKCFSCVAPAVSDQTKELVGYLRCLKGLGIIDVIRSPSDKGELTWRLEVNEETQINTNRRAVSRHFGVDEELLLNIHNLVFRHYKNQTMPNARVVFPVVKRVEYSNPDFMERCFEKLKGEYPNVEFLPYSLDVEEQISSAEEQDRRAQDHIKNTFGFRTLG